LYESGADYRELATKYGVSTACVCDTLRAAGLQSRTGWAKYRTHPWQDKKGKWHRFKSSWELAYAKYLDDQNKNWKYEPHHYTLEICRRYTPDFEIYDIDGTLKDMVDVKGWLNESTERRMLEFVSTYPSMPLRVIGCDEMIKLGLIDPCYAKHPMTVRVQNFKVQLETTRHAVIA
jgi:hypothetical protein